MCVDQLDAHVGVVQRAQRFLERDEGAEDLLDLGRHCRLEQFERVAEALRRLPQLVHRRGRRVLLGVDDPSLELLEVRDELRAHPVTTELASGFEVLELPEVLETATFPHRDRGAQRVRPFRKTGAEALADMAQRGALERAGLVAHLLEGVELHVEVSDLAERVLEIAHHAVGPAHALAVAEQDERRAQAPGGHARVVYPVGIEARTELSEVPLHVGPPGAEESACGLGHGRGCVQTADGGGLGHRRSPPYPGSNVDWAERAGVVGGWALAAVTGPGAWLRRARFFHPEGVVYLAKVTSAGADARTRAVGERLAGPALVRFSSAVWRKHEWKDVLGMAVRFRRTTVPSADPEPTDQDLLLATIRTPWTTLVAAIPTRVHDFLKNQFHGVSPFQVDDDGRVKLRFRAPKQEERPGRTRQERLDQALEAGRAVLTLEMRPLGVLGTWQPVATLVLERQVQVDQAALRFSPFRTGRGLVPRGFVHALRVATYAASQALRPRSSADAGPDAGRALRESDSRAR